MNNPVLRKFSVAMNGRNFLIEMDGKREKHGFYQVFFVEAVSPADAESHALKSIRNQNDLRQSTLNASDDPPTIHVDEIKELGEFSGDNRAATGRGWYREDDSE